MCSCNDVAGQVSEAFLAWFFHWFVLKALMYLLGASSAIPFLELLSYAGYTFVPTCAALTAHVSLGLHLRLPSHSICCW